jgi:cathepsin B
MNLTTKELKLKIESLPTNTIINEKDFKPTYIYKKIITNSLLKLPENFNGMKIWNNKLSPVFNQGNCGSCWAFASNSSLADRFNIQSLGLYNITLSPTKMLLCSTLKDKTNIEVSDEIQDIANFACFGNTLINACNYLYTFGCNTIECISYDNFDNISNFQSLQKFKNYTKIPLCSTISGPYLDMCDKFIRLDKRKEILGNPARFYRTNRVYGIYGTTKYNSKGSEEQIRLDIYKWGPICTAFIVYSDFYTFDSKNDIYQWDGKSPETGGHAVEIVGWGEENGKKYWQIKNSWGTEWGNNGYFKMIRGINNCFIEDNCIGMMPDFFYPTNYIKNQDIEYIVVDEENKTKIDNIRNDFINNPTGNGGGIIPTTGYSRRTMRDDFHLDINRPVELYKLPNWKTFIAGNNANFNNYTKPLIKNYNKTIISFIYIGIILIIIFLIFFLLYKK